MTSSSPQSHNSQSISSVSAPEMQGTWLFKDQGGVLGPVTPELIVDRLQKLELSAQVLFTREIGQAWLPLSGITTFQETFNRAQTLKRQQQEEQELQKKQKVQNILHKLIWAVLIIFPLFLGLIAGKIAAKQDLFNETKKWAKQTPPLLAILPPPIQNTPVSAPVTHATANKKTSKIAKETAAGENKKNITHQTSKPQKRTNRTSKKNRNKKNAQIDKQAAEHLKNKKNQQQKAGKTQKAEIKKNVPKQNKNKVKTGLRSLSAKQIKAGLSKGGKGFRRCIMAALKKENNGLPSIITIAFSVANDGKAVNVKLLERQARKTPLEKCLQKIVAKLKWPEFYGERKYTEIPFRISKPKK